MLVRTTAISSGSAALALALVACNPNPPSSSTTVTPESKPTPETVTNTNATLPAGGDVLASVANRGRITEPPDEAKITPTKSVRISPGFSIPVRAAPHGDWIASLAATASVNEVARDARGDYYLVTYPDVDDTSKQLAGWVFKDAVENTAWMSQDPTIVPPKSAATSKTATLSCGKGESHLKTDHDFCAKACRDDVACSKTQSEACDGLAFEVRDGATRLETARYCVSTSTAPGTHPIN
jgi:hypothetical protein